MSKASQGKNAAPSSSLPAVAKSKAPTSKALIAASSSTSANKNKDSAQDKKNKKLPLISSPHKGGAPKAEPVAPADHPNPAAEIPAPAVVIFNDETVDVSITSSAVKTVTSAEEVSRAAAEEAARIAADEARRREEDESVVAAAILKENGNGMIRVKYEMYDQEFPMSYVEIFALPVIHQ